MIPSKTVVDVYVTLSGKIVAVHTERIWSTTQVEKRQEARNAKGKAGRPSWKLEARDKSPMEKDGDFKQEIPRKQITS